MDRNQKILVCGLYETVNRAFMRRLKREGFLNIFDTSKTSLDLVSQASVKSCFNDYKPNIIIYTGSVGGGIAVNIKHPAELLYRNTISQANVMNTAKETGIDKLIFFASSCVYPRESSQPIKEEHLLTGSLEETSAPYAISKISGIKMCEAYNREYGTNFVAVVPATIYGPDDDFDPITAHVISALINKFHDAKEKNKDFVEIWGSGAPRREFIFADDLVDACIFLLDNYNEITHINVGCSRDYAISELADIMSRVVGYKGNVKYNTNKPDGVMQKLLDSNRINSLGWRPKTTLEKGIAVTYEWFSKYEKTIAKKEST